MRQQVAVGPADRQQVGPGTARQKGGLPGVPPVLEMFTCGWYDGVVREAELPEREDVKQGGKTNVD